MKKFGSSAPPTENSKSLNFVGQNKYESLMERISEENREIMKKKEQEEEENYSSGLNTERRRDIVRAIVSVYFFMRKGLGMAYRPITKEEFYFGAEALREMAQKQVRQRSFWQKTLLFIGFGEYHWEHYLEHGYFSKDSAPFDGWDLEHPWRHCDAEKGHTLGYWDNFSPDVLGAAPVQYNYALPENINELIKEVFEEKYGKKKMPKA